MEVLSDILRGLRAAGSVYFCDFLEPPWEFAYADAERAMFHLLRRGRCSIEVDGEIHDLVPGDFVFMAPGVDHVLRGGEEGEPQSLLLCGYCSFDADEDDPLIRALPRFVLLKHENMDRWPWLTRTLEHLSAEYMSEAPGNELTINKLTEVLLVQLLRADFGRSDAPGIMAALKDRRLSKALTEIHRDPSRHWTIDSAAQVATMSRSGFARSFRETLDMSFFDYLTRLRMRNARELLSTTSLPVADVGERVGYQSDLSFVKAFKKLNGMTPRAYRLGSAQSPLPR